MTNAQPITTANGIIEGQLNERINVIGNLLKANVLTYMGPINDMAHYAIKASVEALPKRNKLVVILETYGGYIEVTERIANTFRHHCRTVDFIVPSFAMSAGTVLVMSGDSIYMDYASVLGPIDPQIQRMGGSKFVPALGYLEQYERLILKSANAGLSSAEVAYLIQNFDPAELYQYEQARDLSINLLEEWLVRYKFKNWKVTASNKVKVTPQMRRDRAAEIARKLNETSKWHSHGRGITMAVLRRTLNLHIDDLHEHVELQSAVDSYYSLLKDYQLRMGHNDLVIHTKEFYHGH